MLPNRPAPYYEDNYTPLHFTAAAGDLDALKVFLALGHNINAVTMNSGNTPLHEAVKESKVDVKSRIDVIEYLLTCENIDPTIQNDMGETLLHFAAASGDVGMLAVLLVRSDITKLLSSQDKDGNTPLHKAVEEQHAEAVKLILEKMKDSSIDPNTKNNSSKTPLHVAAARKHVAIMQSLLEHPDIKLDETDNKGNMALHVAVMGSYHYYWDSLSETKDQKNSIAAVKLLLDSMEKKNINLNLKNKSGKTPLYIAFEYFDSRDMLKLLLEYENIDPNIICGKKGNTLLHKAIRRYTNMRSDMSKEQLQKKYEYEIVELLLKHGKIDPNVRNVQDETPLYWVCQHNARRCDSGSNKLRLDDKNRGVASILIKHDKIDMQDKKNILLDKFIRYDFWSLDDIKLFLTNKKMNLEIQDQYGQTVQHLVVQQGRVDVLSFLLEEGADINAIDKSGNTLLHVATEKRKVEMVVALLERDNVEKNAINVAGNTPLHQAAIDGDQIIIRCLLKAGADPTLRDRERNTASQVAFKHKHWTVADILNNQETQLTEKRKRDGGGGFKSSISISTIPSALFSGSTESRQNIDVVDASSTIRPTSLSPSNSNSGNGG